MNQPHGYPSTARIPKMVIGIGSHHGDDRVGWEVVDQWSALSLTATQLYKACVPHDVLDWLDSQTQTHIVDASQDAAPQVRRFEMQRTSKGQVQIATNAASDTPVVRIELPPLRSGSTHQFDLMGSIQLAAELERIPKTIVLWTVPVLNMAKNGALSSQASRWVEECVARMAEELAYA